MAVSARCALLYLAVAASAPIGGSAAAQAAATAVQDTMTPTPAACDSIIAAARVDTTLMSVRAYLWRSDGNVLAPSITDRILMDLADWISLPQPLRLSVFSAGPIRMQMLAPVLLGSASTRHPVVNGTYSFTLAAGAPATDVEVLIASLTPGFDSAVVAAISHVGVGTSIPVGGVEAPGDIIHMQLHITSGVGDRARSVTLFNAVVPRIPLVDAATSDSLPTPVFPPEELDAQVEGDVVLQFIVDRTGTPVPGTVELLRATTIGFARSAVATLSGLRFSPARVGACPVAQFVQLPLTFTLP